MYIYLKKMMYFVLFKKYNHGKVQNKNHCYTFRISICSIYNPVCNKFYETGYFPRYI